VSGKVRSVLLPATPIVAALVAVALVAPTGGAPTASAPAEKPRVLSVGEVAGEAYLRSVATLPDGSTKYVRWNPCQTAITYNVNATSAGSTTEARNAAIADVKTAMARWSSASGIPTIYKGTTTQIPNNTSTSKWYERQGAEITVAWTYKTAGTTNYSNLWTSGSTAAGLGGYAYKYWGTTGSYQVATGRGYVILDAAQRGKFVNGFGSGATRGALLLHEIGHVAGLKHVSTTSDLMYGTIISRSTTAYSADDKTGLYKLGKSAGCISVPSYVWTDLN
jgi:Matrixin